MATKRTLLFFIVVGVLSCMPQHLIIKQMEPILNNTIQAFFEESDLQIAEQALSSNLKLVEGLLKSDPQNSTLMLILSEGYAGYALAFVEDTNPERARMLYLRARNFAAQFLQANNSHFKHLVQQPVNALTSILKKAQPKDVAGLFWLGFSWSSYINLALEDPSAIMDLAKVEAIMKRVLELNPDYFYGATYLFFGSIYGQKPALLGGDLDKAKAFFEKNFQLTRGKFLLSYVYAARFYAAQSLDEPLFDQYLQKVLNSSIDILPEARLLNQVAKQKAQRLLAQKDEIF